MAERIFFLNRLREGVSRQQGDRFLLERDIPMDRSVPSITSYEVTSVADYHADIARLEGTDEWHAFVAEWEQHVDRERSVPLYGTVLQ